MRFEPKTSLQRYPCINLFDVTPCSPIPTFRLKNMPLFSGRKSLNRGNSNGIQESDARDWTPPLKLPNALCIDVPTP